MAASVPENLPPDHRFREFQDHHYHDEDDHPGAVPPPDDGPPVRRPIALPRKKPGVRLPSRRRFEED
jgi:hypothetical protein